MNRPIFVENRTEISTGRAARILSISRTTVERMCMEGKLEARRVPPRGHWRINYDSVLEMLERMKHPD